MDRVVKLVYIIYWMRSWFAIWVRNAPNHHNPTTSAHYKRENSLSRPSFPLLPSLRAPPLSLCSLSVCLPMASLLLSHFGQWFPQFDNDEPQAPLAVFSSLSMPFVSLSLVGPSHACKGGENGGLSPSRRWFDSRFLHISIWGEYTSNLTTWWSNFCLFSSNWMLGKWLCRLEHACMERKTSLCKRSVTWVSVFGS